jgi:hypothetical protein
MIDRQKVFIPDELISRIVDELREKFQKPTGKLID